MKGRKTIQTIYKTKNGEIINGDNLEVLDTLQENSIDNCISDFPYDLSFMGKKWDNTGDFYQWNKARAEKLYRVIKHGGYVAVFGHPKTNHRMKCAFEDVGFKIVEEIDWIYLTGMPKNQDIGKLFDKKAGAEREVITTVKKLQSYGYEGNTCYGGDVDRQGVMDITAPATEQAKKWDGWKTSGLKPAHEPITIFQKPLEGTYIENIEKYGCGGMNIDACRVPTEEIITNHSRKETSAVSKGIYGDSKEQETFQTDGQTIGRFPANIILDENTAEVLDEQTGISKSSGGSGRASRIGRARHIYRAYNDQVNEDYINPSLGGLGDTGGGSRMFPIIKYNAKVSPSERKLPNGERNPHVTLKPVELIKWLVKLLTPIDGTTIDITAGSCTHGVACEELNKSEKYNLKWIDIELMNTEEEPYCNVGKLRIENVNQERN